MGASQGWVASDPAKGGSCLHGLGYDAMVRKTRKESWGVTQRRTRQDLFGRPGNRLEILPGQALAQFLAQPVKGGAVDSEGDQRQGRWSGESGTCDIRGRHGGNSAAAQLQDGTTTAGWAWLEGRGSPLSHQEGPGCSPGCKHRRPLGLILPGN